MFVNIADTVIEGSVIADNLAVTTSGSNYVGGGGTFVGGMLGPFGSASRSLTILRSTVSGMSAATGTPRSSGRQAWEAAFRRSWQAR